LSAGWRLAATRALPWARVDCGGASHPRGCYGSGEVPFDHRRASEARDCERYEIAEIKSPIKSPKVDVPLQHCRLPFHSDRNRTIHAHVAASVSSSRMRAVASESTQGDLIAGLTLRARARILSALTHYWHGERQATCRRYRDGREFRRGHRASSPNNHITANAAATTIRQAPKKRKSGVSI
jgi:hypothetical protein